jgi:glycerophosphoryl diester phosphodiesterase
MTEPADALPLGPALPRDGSRCLPPLVSAHRAGLAPDRPGQDPRAALRAVLDAGCDLVELDVRRTRDGVPVVEHEDEVAVGGRPVPVGALTAAELAATTGGCLPLEEALRMLAGRAGAHLDLKQVGTADDLVALVDLAVGRLGVENVVVTGLSDEDVATVRAWCRDRCPELLVGLALGRELPGLSPLRLVRTALEELFPGGRLRRSDATLIVCQKELARAWIARWARRRRLPLLIWTVNKPAELRRWLADPRIWAVTTDHPRTALALRRGRAGRWPVGRRRLTSGEQWRKGRQTGERGRSSPGVPLLRQAGTGPTPRTTRRGRAR